MWHDIKMLNAISGSLFALAALALMFCGLLWLVQRPIFTLKLIRVEDVGVQLRHIDRSSIRSIAVPRMKGNFFTIDLDAVRVVFESVPWVRKASVRREWPNKLIVELEEHEALGTWGDDGRLLSMKGDVFTANLAEAEEDGELLEFDGPEGSEKDVVKRLDELRQWFAPVNLVPDGVRLSSRYAWTVKLNTGITVELGREQSSTTVKERVARLVEIYPQLVAQLQDRIESVDMRYPNGLALKASGMSFGATGIKTGNKPGNNNKAKRHD